MKNSKRNRWAIIILIPIILLGLTLFFIQYHFESIVKNLIVTELNQNLLVKARASEIKFSVWENFPKASLSFNNIQIESSPSLSNRGPQKPLVSKGNVSLSFNIIDLVSGNYTIEQIKISNAMVNLFATDSSHYNFEIWKKEAKEQANPEVNFSIKKITIEESRINFNASTRKNFVDASIDKAILKAKWSDNKISLDGNVKGIAHKILTESLNFNQIDFQWEGNYYSEKSNWGIQTKEVFFFNKQVDAKGMLMHTHSGEKIDMKILAHDLPLMKIKENLSSLWPKAVNKYSLSGLIDANIGIKGYLNDQLGPHLSADYQFKKSTLGLGTNKVGASNINLQGNFSGSAGNSKSFLLKIEKFSATIEKQVIVGKIKWSGKTPDYLETHLEGVFDMSRLSDFVAMDSIGTTSGKIHFDLDSKIPLGKNYVNNLAKWQISGQMEGNNLNFESTDKNIGISQLKGRLVLSGGNAEIENVSLNFRESNFKINGKLKNWNEFINGTNESSFDGRIHCEKIDIDKIFGQNKSTGNGQNKNWGIPLKISAKVTAGNINYKKLNLSALQTKLLLSDNRIILDSLKLVGLGGKGSGKIQIQTQTNGGFFLRIDGNLQQIDIKELFKSFDNFEQQTLRQDHISGKMNATVSFSATYDKESNINLPSIQSLGDIKISNGKLSNFSPLFSLSKYISMEELNDISFSELTNTIKIENSKIEFPQMEILSSAMNLKVQGIHYFSNKIDYHFSIQLSELLNKKFKIKNRNKDEFGDFEEEENRPKKEIFVSLSGSVDHPVFSIDKSAMKKSRKEKWKEEKNIIQTLLKNGGVENETNKKTSFEKSENMFSIENDGEELKTKKLSEKSNKSTDKTVDKKPKETEKNKTEKNRKKNKVEKSENSDDFN